MSGEVQQLSVQAEVSPLMRVLGGLLLSKEGRRLRAALRREAADGMVGKARLSTASDAAMDAMDSIKEVDEHRRALARGDELLDALLVRVELAHVSRVVRVQRGGGSRDERA